jgi:predicted metal-dependent hydrolase
LKRYTSLQFPKQKFLPGQGQAHPDKLLPEVLQTANHRCFSAETWKFSQPYLYAIDLFNAGYWWEAHEILEMLWNETGRRSETAEFLQGLIQICAALLKKSQSVPAGALRLKKKGILHLSPRKGTYLGIETNRLIQAIERYFKKPGIPPPQIRLRGVDKDSTSSF